MSRHYLALIPLLSLMAISPNQLKITTVYRQPANLVDQLNDSPYPKYESRAKKVDLSTLAVDKKITLEKYLEKSKLNSDRISKERTEFKCDIKVKADLDTQQKMLNEIVMDLVIQDELLKGLVANKSFPDEKSQKNAEAELKNEKMVLELMLVDVVDSEVLVLNEETMNLKKENEKSKVAVADPKKVDEKKDDKPEVKVEDKKEDDKKVSKADEDKYAAYDKRVCAIEDSNKALMEQITKLSADNSKIIDIMLSMQQQMLQRPAFTPYYAYPQVQQPIYNFQPQAPMGQYSLMPAQQQQGQQQNPQQVQAPQYDIWGNTPNQQMSQYQPIMGVNPQSYSQYDTRYSQTANLLTGQFGGANQMGFNFGGDAQFSSQFQQQRLGMM